VLREPGDDAESLGALVTAGWQAVDAGHAVEAVIVH
jgi:hypothetical protein